MSMPRQQVRGRRAAMSAAACFLAAHLLATSPAVSQPGSPAALPADSTHEQALLRVLGPAFRLGHSSRFSILYDTDPDAAARLLHLAESTFDRVHGFADRLRMPTRPLAFKLSIAYFNTWHAYEAYAREARFVVNQGLPGFFDQRSNRCVMFNFANAEAVLKKSRALQRARQRVVSATQRQGPADERAGRERAAQEIERIEAQLAVIRETINTTVICHEIAHQVLHNLGIQNAEDRDRRWLREGLAMQFEGAGAVNVHRLADFDAAFGGGAAIHLRSLVGDPKRIGPGADDLPAAYAAAWALVHYLVTERPNAFAAYLRNVPASTAKLSGRAAERARIRSFEAAFGTLDTNFERKLRQHAHRLRHAQPVSRPAALIPRDA